MHVDDPAQIRELLGVPFSEEQLAAITAPLEPGVIIAGAGTGKTTVMAARVVWLVATGAVTPEQVLGLTFTRKAAGELAQRVAASLETAGVRHQLSDEAREVVSTYDAFAARLVGEFGLRLGFDADARMLSGAGRHRLATRVVADHTGRLEYLNRLSHVSIPQMILELDAQLQANLVDPSQVREFSEQTRERFLAAPLRRDGGIYADVAEALRKTEERLELLELVEHYQRLKRARGYVEHADQLRAAVELVQQVPAVGAAMRSRFRVVLLDEYQDTSAAQVSLLHTLFSGASASAGRGFPVTAVGDPHQAIYGWRGAAATNILGFAERFPRAGGSPASRFSLRINRRSATAILGAGNALVGDLTSGGAAGVELVAPEGTEEGRVEAFAYDTFDEEIDALVERVIEAQQETGSWSKIAVLTRTNQLVSDVFATLRERDVPAEISGIGGLVRLPEIAPVVAMLRVLDDDGANPDVAGLLSGPRWNLGLPDLEALGRRAVHLTGGVRRPDADGDLAHVLNAVVAARDPIETPSLLEAVMNPGAEISEEGRRRLSSFAAVVRQVRQHRDEPLLDLVRRVVTALGVEVEILVQTGHGAQLGAFLGHVSQYCAAEEDESLTGLISWLDTEDDFGEGLEQAAPSTADSVKLMTVHRAKGLEWDTVFLPGMAEGQFPNQDRSGIWPTRAALLPSPLRGDADGVPQLSDHGSTGLKEYKARVRAEHVSSETRLAYVAATRARRALVVSTHVWTPGNKRARTRSRYFEQVAEACGALHEPAAVSEANPVPDGTEIAAWPEPVDAARAAGLSAACRLVTEAADQLASGEDVDEWVRGSGLSDPAGSALIRAWDEDYAAIVSRSEARRRVTLPEGLSATMIIAMKSDPARFARQLVRPMPRQPSRSATRGSHFHAWVQKRFELTSAFEELDTAPVMEDLDPLIRAFEAGRFAHRSPLGVEIPFLLRWGHHVLRGRIDAAYAWNEGGYRELVVDWKTSEAPADPLQLAVYRLAWAEARGLDPSEVGAAFYHVRSDDLRVVEAPTSLIEEAMGG